MSQNNQVGRSGEDLAKDYLIKKGYTFIQANFHTKYGEIDLIFEHDGVLVFVEVKTRQSDVFGDPAEAITPAKLKKLRIASQIYMQQFPKQPERGIIEAVCIYKYMQEIIIKHYKNII